MILSYDTLPLLSASKNLRMDYLALNSRSTESPIEDGLKPRINFRDEAMWGSSLFVLFLLEGPPVTPVLLTGPDDFELNIDEPKEASCAPNDTGPLCDVSSGYPTAPSWWGGGNFSLLLLAFACVTILHLCSKQIITNVKS